MYHLRDAPPFFKVVKHIEEKWAQPFTDYLYVMYRLRDAQPFFKEGFLKDVTPNMTCLLGDKWTEQVEEEKSQ